MEHLRQRLNPKTIGNQRFAKGKYKPYGQFEDDFQVTETTL
jgi:hypothetical protein